MLTTEVGSNQVAFLCLYQRAGMTLWEGGVLIQELVFEDSRMTGRNLYLIGIFS